MENKPTFSVRVVTGICRLIAPWWLWNNILTLLVSKEFDDDDADNVIWITNINDDDDDGDDDDIMMIDEYNSGDIQPDDNANNMII